LERAGEIQGLELQPEFELVVNGYLICKYRGDFRYTEEGKEIIHDCKGFRTKEYKIKKKLMSALYAIDVRET